VIWASSPGEGEKVPASLVVAEGKGGWSKEENIKRRNLLSYLNVLAVKERLSELYIPLEKKGGEGGKRDSKNIIPR